jgi:hypothetical protein
MQMVGIILIAIGILIGVIGEIMLLAIAFRKSVWWLVACLFLSPTAELIFLILHWKEGKRFLFKLSA